MANWLKYVMAFASAFALMLAFRTLALSIHSVTGNGLAPLYDDGDCVLVNRCSYGLRIAGNGLLPYSRLLRRPVSRGDIVAFSIQSDTQSCLLVARCTAIPGDTLHTLDGPLLVPGIASCADADYYWLEAINPANPVDSRHLGLISERNIVGRVVSVLYNRHRLSAIPRRILTPNRHSFSVARQP